MSFVAVGKLVQGRVDNMCSLPRTKQSFNYTTLPNHCESRNMPAEIAEQETHFSRKPCLADLPRC